MLNTDRILEIFGSARDAGIIQQIIEDTELDGRTVTIGGKRVINFASCGYLGIEFDARLREAAIDALRRYGTQFSSSRAYLSVTLYNEAERLLSKICGRPALLVPTTSLGHQATLPTLVSAKDAILLDQHVHNSVQVGIYALRMQGASVSGVPHNRADILEEKIEGAARAKDKVWYLMDGLYSMYGSHAPFDELNRLLEAHPKLHIYCDDAHATGWRGDKGQGFALERWADHPRVIGAISLNKSFGCAGGVIAFPNAETLQLVRHLGQPMIFSGPVQPPLLGAIVASAQIHLSGELAALQDSLADRIQYFNDATHASGLKLVDSSISPIRFIEIGPTEQTIATVATLLERGFYVNCAAYPAVPEDRAGLRITITNHLNKSDIDDLLTEITKLVGVTRKENSQ